ncbi:MAG: polysaccharide deacetylase family protein, partial [Clostridia bacterium]|nr:polysaccharide deacetylase family protein [Clostridia bacterium]
MSIGYTEQDGEKVKIENFLINGYYGTASQIYAQESDFLFNCLHKFEQKTIRESTYRFKGSEQYVCKCGFIKTEEKDFLQIPALPLSSAKPDGDGVKLKWKAIKDIEKYNIYRSVDGGKFEFVSSSVDTEYIDYESKSVSIKYYITGAAGKYEGKKVVKPVQLDYIKSPYLKLNSTKQGVKLKWEMLSDISKYRVYKRTEDSKYKLLFETASALEFVDKAVKKHSKYFYTVVSVDKQGKESSKSEFGKPIIFGEKAKVVYLTFDDGPSENALKILKILKKYNVKATFFVTNLDEPKYMKNIVDEGHQIALHTYSHNYKKLYSSEKNYFEDLEKIGDLVKEQTGIIAKVIRFPGGSSNTVSAEYS